MPAERPRSPIERMPRRIQRSRAKGWKMPSGAIYVGRPTRWGNPFNFRSGEYCWAALSFGCRSDAAGRQEASVRAYRDWIAPPHGRQTISFEEQPKLGFSTAEVALGPAIKAGAAPSLAEIRETLGGHDLVCWCSLDQPCHADILLVLANPGLDLSPPPPSGRRG